jgi:hypothetical protein
MFGEWWTKGYFDILDSLYAGQKVVSWFSWDKNLGFCPVP